MTNLQTTSLLHLAFLHQDSHFLRTDHSRGPRGGPRARPGHETGGPGGRRPRRPRPGRGPGPAHRPPPCPKSAQSDSRGPRERAAGLRGVCIPRYTYTNEEEPRNHESINLPNTASHGIDGRARPAACCGPTRVADKTRVKGGQLRRLGTAPRLRICLAIAALTHRHKRRHEAGGKHRTRRRRQDGGGNEMRTR